MGKGERRDEKRRCRDGRGGGKVTPKLRLGPITIFSGDSAVLTLSRI